MGIQLTANITFLLIFRTDDDPEQDMMKSFDAANNDHSNMNDDDRSLHEEDEQQEMLNIQVLDDVSLEASPSNSGKQ